MNVINKILNISYYNSNNKKVNISKKKIIKSYYHKKILQNYKILEGVPKKSKKYDAYLRKTDFFSFYSIFGDMKSFFNSGIKNFMHKQLININTKKKLTILEIGGGSSSLHKEIIKKYKINRYYLTDLMFSKNEIINKRLFKQNLDLNNIFFKAKTDMVIAINCFHLAKNLKKTINDIYKIKNVQRLTFTVPSLNMLESKQKGFLLNILYLLFADIKLKANFKKNLEFYTKVCHETKFENIKIKKIKYKNYIINYGFILEKTKS